MSKNRTVKKPAPPGGSKPPQKGYVAPTPKKAGGVSPVVLVVVALVVIGVVAAIAVALTSGGDTVRTDPGVEQTRSVTVEGDALPSYDSSQPVDAAVGVAAPTLEGKTFDGTPITINPGGGERYTMVVFAAHWCPHCQKEIPVIADWMAAGKKPANLDVYAVSTGVRTDYMSAQANWPSSAWFERVGWPMDTVVADSGPDQEQAGEEPNAAGNAYGLTGYPMVTMVGPDGNVIERHSGEFDVQGNPETFEAWVARTMAASS